ncbi:hypothetical protein [Flavobacterium sp.]|uniref:hypothetical protein n=1 Tax=Flavobacterium sp. TaxID=239 RepID=UPI00403321F4
MKRLLITMISILTLSANAGATSNERERALAFAQGDYKEIGITAVPTDILRSLTKRYKGFLLDEAWISEEDGFRLSLSNERKHITSFYKSTGEFIKDEVK